MKRFFFETAIMIAIAIGLTATLSWTAETETKGADSYFFDCEAYCR